MLLLFFLSSFISLPLLCDNKSCIAARMVYNEVIAITPNPIISHIHEMAICKFVTVEWDEKKKNEVLWFAIQDFFLQFFALAVLFENLMIPWEEEFFLSILLMMMKTMVITSFLSLTVCNHLTRWWRWNEN